MWDKFVAGVDKTDVMSSLVPELVVASLAKPDLQAYEKQDQQRMLPMLVKRAKQMGYAVVDLRSGQSVS